VQTPFLSPKQQYQITEVQCSVIYLLSSLVYFHLVKAVVDVFSYQCCDWFVVSFTKRLGEVKFR